VPSSHLWRNKRRRRRVRLNHPVRPRSVDPPRKRLHRTKFPHSPRTSLERSSRWDILLCNAIACVHLVNTTPVQVLDWPAAAPDCPSPRRGIPNPAAGPARNRVSAGVGDHRPRRRRRDREARRVDSLRSHLATGTAPSTRRINANKVGSARLNASAWSAPLAPARPCDLVPPSQSGLRVAEVRIERVGRRARRFRSMSSQWRIGQRTEAPSEAAMSYSVPNISAAVVDPQKLHGYLLSPDHPVGRHKARVFACCGYARQNADELIAELKRVLQYGQLVDVVESFYGSKYIVEGDLRCFSGDRLGIRTVWIVEAETGTPRFVTAYPV
jgi:hypothetical protein